MRRLYTARENLILLFTAIVLTIVGIIFIYDFTKSDNAYCIETFYLIRQSTYAVCGLVCAFLLSRFDYHRLYTIYLWIFFMAVAIIILNFAMNLGGSNRGYFQIGSVWINMSQLILTVSILMFVGILQHENIFSVKAVSCCLAFAALFCLIGDFQGMMLFAIIIFPIAFIKEWKAALTFAAPAAAGIICIIQKRYYVPKRIDVWLDPFMERYDLGYEIVNSMYSIASGGMFGVGVGEGKTAYCLPDAHSTYIIAGITREIGWFGALEILFVYCIFLGAAFKIACRSVDKYGFYIAAAITVRYSVMLILHLFTAANMIPAFGVFLPFISYNGTGLLTDFALLGILLNIARQKAENDRRMGI
ncbi:MAG: FtsW/RodA/SpoVE family cell cycle protein [Lachnospiraceae bacterium]|nr:FtsW/RodA/SpoVE family cell cycle protein [Lachnospiraceae bacterium]